MDTGFMQEKYMTFHFLPSLQQLLRSLLMYICVYIKIQTLNTLNFILTFPLTG